MRAVCVAHDALIFRLGEEVRNALDESTATFHNLTSMAARVAFESYAERHPWPLALVGATRMQGWAIATSVHWNAD
jgi:hypothetical protein